MPTNLATLISNIPIAEDGHVITRRYHNSMRDALAALAAQMGATTGSDRVAVTLAPNFQPAEPQPPWAFALGVASKAAGGACDGWLPLSLPDGARIQRMAVIGGRSGAPVPPAVFTFQVQLVRQPLREATTISLITITGLATTATERDPFELDGQFAVPGVTAPSAISEFQTVNNSQYKYMIRARLVSATASMVVTIYAIRVEYELGGGSTGFA